LPSLSAWCSTAPAEKVTVACGRSPISECCDSDNRR
jgi:hypothetical protein